MIRVGGATSADLAAVEEVMVRAGQDALHGVAAGVARGRHSGLKSKMRLHIKVSRTVSLKTIKNQRRLHNLTTELI